MAITSEAKKLLSSAIRGSKGSPQTGLRQRMIDGIRNESERRYQWALAMSETRLDEAHRAKRARIEEWVREQVRMAGGHDGSEPAEDLAADDSGASTKSPPKSKAAKKPKPEAASNASKKASAKSKQRAGASLFDDPLAQQILADAHKLAAATFLNRMIVVRQLEARRLLRPEVVTGGWESKGYQEFLQVGAALCARDLPGSGSKIAADGTEGLGTLLQLIFDELAVDMPGLFGDGRGESRSDSDADGRSDSIADDRIHRRTVNTGGSGSVSGITRLFPISPSVLRDVIDTLNLPALASAWDDDTTLGWVYQYWNDPDREALDDKIADGGKILPGEIAAKTQMFTERYMVEWLLQNSVGLTWLCMCRKNGWVAEAESSGMLAALEARRIEWRAKRDAGDVTLDALMPVAPDEAHWKYYVPQPLPAADSPAVQNAPTRLQDLKLLDPACGSGHFLVIAFDLLAALYREQARHTGEVMTDREIAETIIARNLHGIDIDPRAVQIAAAALFLKARTLDKHARPAQVNLVAPALQLGKLRKTDPARVRLVRTLEREAGIPATLTDELLEALAGVDYLGSLLKVGGAIDAALAAVEGSLGRSSGQGHLIAGFAKTPVSADEARVTALDALEAFLAAHSASSDIGLLLDGAQLAAGVRFVRMVREGSYDVVVGNPPYQGLSKTAKFGYVVENYPMGKADLYAAFLQRGLELVRPGGLSAMVTKSDWLALSAFSSLRKHLRETCCLKTLADLGPHAFEQIGGEVVRASMSVFVMQEQSTAIACRLLPEFNCSNAPQKAAGLMAQVGQYEFDPRGFSVIEGEPIVYWWSKDFLARYAAAPKLGDVSPAMKGLCTGDNTRFNRLWHEVALSRIWLSKTETPTVAVAKWSPTIKGASGREWIEPLTDLLEWQHAGLHLRVFETVSRGVRFQNVDYYFRLGIAFTGIGAKCGGRAHRYVSVFGDKGASFFPASLSVGLATINASRSRMILESLNPTISFTPGDVNRLAVEQIDEAEAIFRKVEQVFESTEQSLESSVEFRKPHRVAWSYAQRWAQLAVDRPPNTPLPPYEPEYEEPEPIAYVSFAIGVALGRFGGNGEGILDPSAAINGKLDATLPHGILFVGDGSATDSLQHPACAPVLAAWQQHSAAILDAGSNGNVATDDLEALRDYLRSGFFGYHKKLYENRPIYFPLSSAKKTFVAYVSIHRWGATTLGDLLAEHLLPLRKRIEGELTDNRQARIDAAAGTAADRNRTAKRIEDLQKQREELADFIAHVEQIARAGAPAPDAATPERETDAKFVMDLDDGVMVNSAALWPLLEPQWKDPKKWWKELCTAKGKKDYDWSHLAARYFPTRVDAKCHKDPSLAVAHHCFWRLHPAKAYQWELRLQDEIRPDFTIDEPGSDAARKAYLKDHPAEAAATRAKESDRRAKKAAKAASKTTDNDYDGPLFDGADNDGDGDEA